MDFEIKRHRLRGFDRDQAEQRKKAEGEWILSQLDESETLILFDERGKNLNSIEFAQSLARVLESGQRRITLLVGGPFGVGENIKNRAQQKWGLSPLTFNHLVAGIVTLEQLYRAMTIIKRIPYHN